MQFVKVENIFDEIWRFLSQFTPYNIEVEMRTIISLIKRMRKAVDYREFVTARGFFKT